MAARRSQSPSSKAKAKKKKSPSSAKTTAATTTTTRKRGKSSSSSKKKKGTRGPVAAAGDEQFPYEFGGPCGALATMVALPLVIYALYFLCRGRCSATTDVTHSAAATTTTTTTVVHTASTVTVLSHHLSPDFCLEGFSPAGWLSAVQADLFSPAGRGAAEDDDFDWAHFLSLWGDVLWDNTAAAVVLCWFGFQVALERLLPGEMALGVELPQERGRLAYPLNGHLAFWVSLLALGLGHLRVDLGSGTSVGPLLDLTYCYDHYVHLASAALLFSAVLSVYLYASSFWRQSSGEHRLLAQHGDSGNAVYDFFIGRELNPRILNGTFDLKYFCELRPGLIGWIALNLGCMLKQYQDTGTISGAMALVNVGQGLYVWDALFNERAILTTMDITTDGFGFMLAFGDLAWVPFTYSLQARYLVSNPGAEGPLLLAAILALNVLGYAVFRGANGEKDAFRRDPGADSVRHLKWMRTKRGTKLLVSGWWGMARKINYTGDWLMGLSWCLCAGFGHLFPYFYAIYFAILLIHRAMRDDEQCAAKYGADWPKYKKRVPHVFIPGVL